ncbi:MAG: hypothetical protein KF787_04550 [Phycisphaeraceae bacterium]|nr:hypothetical protein [Phycisphaerae bacterium]MBX3391898.1 hypothetical protein [Phycisphaeraceae bacterium]HRJ50551.1 hypothetical protein [Phycisphaerales bacterium]
MEGSLPVPGPFSADPGSPGRVLRGHHGGSLRIADRVTKVAYVIDPGTGCPVVPLAADGAEAPTDEEASSLVLMIPDEDEASLQLLCSAADLDARTHESPDRHMIYHGPSRERRWALLRVEAARMENKVFDPLLIVAPNPLRVAEARLCKRFNAMAESVKDLARRVIFKGTDVGVMVGVDPLGIDVRTRFGPGRAWFAHPAMDAAAAEAAIEFLLGVSGLGAGEPRE